MAERRGDGEVRACAGYAKTANAWAWRAVGPCALVAAGAGAACTAEAWGGPLDADKAERRPAKRGVDSAPLIAALNEARRGRGLHPVELLEYVTELESALRLIAGGANPRDAFRTALQRVADDETSDVVGWVFKTSRLDVQNFPERVVEAPDASIAVAIARHGQEDYIVCLVLFEGGYATDLQRTGDGT